MTWAILSPMNIQQNWQKIKGILVGELFMVLLLILVGFLSFGLGRLSHAPQERVPVRILPHESAAIDSFTRGAESGISQGAYVASKNSDKYHLPWCSGAQRIKEANKIWFASKEEAEAAGYLPAGNCPGLTE